ncbi:hypothetical protein LTR66_013955 [Elasticomyces elasticus]|nr:hypothetical protein LTR66_013955 [Elasticomyces elasticus]
MHTFTFIIYSAWVSLEETMSQSGYSYVPWNIVYGGVVSRNEQHCLCGGVRRFGTWGFFDLMFGTGADRSSYQAPDQDRLIKGPSVQVMESGQLLGRENELEDQTEMNMMREILTAYPELNVATSVPLKLVVDVDETKVDSPTKGGTRLANSGIARVKREFLETPGPVRRTTRNSRQASAITVSDTE